MLTHGLKTSRLASLISVNSRSNDEPNTCIIRSSDLKGIPAEELNFQLAMAQTLVEVCETSGWDYGEIWVPSGDAAVLKLSPFWCITSSRDSTNAKSLEQFRLCSEGFVISIGEGLPGRVWQSQKFELISVATDQSESYFLRNQIAKAFDICAGFGVPMMMNDQVSAVLALFMLKNC